MNNDQNQKVREVKLGRKAKQRGLILIKDTFLNDGSGYMIVRADSNRVEYGENFNLTLQDVEKFLGDKKTAQN